MADRVFKQLRDQIITGELRQDSLHSIYEIAETLAVSRTPVREAVVRLADTGMVVIERNRGFRIRGLTVDDVRAVFEFRLIIETTSASYAAQKADPPTAERLRRNFEKMKATIPGVKTVEFTKLDREFHDLITTTMNNPRVRRELSALRDATQSMGVTTMGRAERLHEIHHEHGAVVEAITAGDAFGAAHAMARHLTHSGLVIMGEVAERTGDHLPEDWPGYILTPIERGASHPG